MFCKNCGKEVADGLKFCPACGGAMEETTPVYDATPQAYGAQQKTGFALDAQKKKLIAIVAAVLVVAILAIIFIPKLFGGVKSAEDLAIKAVEANLENDLEYYEFYMYDYYDYTERRWTGYAEDNDMTLEEYIEEKAFDEYGVAGITTVKEYYEEASNYENVLREDVSYSYDCEAMVKKEYSEDKNSDEFEEEIEYILESQAEYGSESRFYGIDVDKIEEFADVVVHVDAEVDDNTGSFKVYVTAVKYDGAWKLYEDVDFDY